MYSVTQWQLEGLRVYGRYMNQFDVSGTVELSRVKYGGTISHHVVLDQPITVYGAVRDRVILEHKEISKISG